MCFGMGPTSGGGHQPPNQPANEPRTRIQLLCGISVFIFVLPTYPEDRLADSEYNVTVVAAAVKENSCIMAVVVVALLLPSGWNDNFIR